MVSGQDFSVSFSTRSGALESFQSSGRALLAGPLLPNFWRAPTDNDRGNRMPWRQGMWRSAGEDRKILPLKIEEPSPQTVRVMTGAVLSPGASSLRINYTIHGSGDVIVAVRFFPGAPVTPLPRFGSQMAVPGAMRHIQWYGRGPQESYWDRKTGAAVGIHSGEVKDLIHPYVRPQENGNRTDVRWVSLRDKDGWGLLAQGLPLIEFSVWPYTQRDLEECTHNYQLPRRDTLTLNLDLKQMGVGGDDSWGAPIHPEYTLPPQPYAYAFRLTPLKGAETDLPSLLRIAFP